MMEPLPVEKAVENEEKGGQNSQAQPLPQWEDISRAVRREEDDEGPSCYAVYVSYSSSSW